ncbi:MAG: NUDIX hydrolase [Microbacteriaceae bacterium]|nr:NUDIX hydrolase [Microbacteriaceae bacterium]
MTGLDEYPRPSVAVDPVIFCVYRDRLCVALDTSSGTLPRLPGTFVHEGETLEQAIRRGLTSKLGITVERIEQLHVFDQPGRDPRGWVLSVAHFALVNEHALDALPPRDIRPVEDLPRLDYDHSAMIERALLALRKQYLDTPDPWRILEHFTLGELRAFHERIDPGTHLRDTFRRVMEPQLIEVMDAPRTSTGGRPSRVWRTPRADEALKVRYASEAKESRDSLASLGTRASSRQFSVEFFWSDGSTSVHERLREREAFRLFDDFVFDATSTQPDATTAFPVKAVMRNEVGDVMRDRDL